MVGYIKTRRAFKTVSGRLPVAEYDAAIEALDKYKSKFVVSADIGINNTGNWFIADSHLWVIDEISIDNGVSTLTCLQPAEAFNRYIPYNNLGATTVGELIAETLSTHYRYQRDLFYAVPYLEIYNYDDTPLIEPETDSDGLWSLAEYLRTMAKEQKVFCEFTVNGPLLRVEIYKKYAISHSLVFGRGGNELVANTFSRAEVAKITTVQGDTQLDWYLSTDGSVSNEAPAGEMRVDGEWVWLFLDEDDDAAAEVSKEFDAAPASHKIEWYSDSSFDLGDKLTMRLNGVKVTGEVTYIGITSADDRTYYHSGELATTLADKLRGIV